MPLLHAFAARAEQARLFHRILPVPLQLPGGTFSAYDAWVALMQRCWAEKPEERPTFEQVGFGWPALHMGTEQPQAHP